MLNALDWAACEPKVIVINAKLVEKPSVKSYNATIKLSAIA
jgi:hypothetical protein